MSGEERVSRQRDGERPSERALEGGSENSAAGDLSANIWASREMSEGLGMRGTSPESRNGLPEVVLADSQRPGGIPLAGDARQGQEQPEKHPERQAETPQKFTERVFKDFTTEQRAQIQKALEEQQKADQEAGRGNANGPILTRDNVQKFLERIADPELRQKVAEKLLGKQGDKDKPEKPHPKRGGRKGGKKGGRKGGRKGGKSGKGGGGKSGGRHKGKGKKGGQDAKPNEGEKPKPGEPDPSTDTEEPDVEVEGDASFGAGVGVEGGAEIEFGG